jgi:hypothetical protein
MKRNKNDTVPTRLLHIRPNSQAHLCTVPQGKDTLYAALSYRWGETQQQKDGRTMRANLHDRYGRINISQLPQSIIDAVKVTQTLELSYLWVDALCIVQDDPLDCASEISKMASIYRGATVTISAASAKDSTEGFLGNRDLMKAYGNLFEFPYYNKRAGDVAQGVVLLSEQPIGDTYAENIDERAWTMQEDILSLRLLRFGSKQTTWRCVTYCQAKGVDGGGYPTLATTDSACAVDNPYRKTEVQSEMSAFGLLGGSRVMAEWMHTVSKYTHRELTNPSDRLPACAALAENFADVMGLDTSDYLAGLWKNDIYAQLLWYCPKVTKAGRTSGPSWSWASINGPVEFYTRTLLEYEYVVKAAAMYVASYMDYKSGNNKYSEVRSGVLELNGRLQRAHWDFLSLRRSINDADVLPSEIYWDVSGSVSPQTVWCFEIIGSYVSLGLVLVTEDQKHFERVGYFECKPGEGSLAMKSFFDETKPQTIVLY